MNENNPSAFPQLPAQVYSYVTHERLPDVPGKPGMTLRDYFAAKTLAGFCTITNLPKDTDLPQFWKATAILAYKMADAMLEERKEMKK